MGKENTRWILPDDVKDDLHKLLCLRRSKLGREKARQLKMEDIATEIFREYFKNAGITMRED